jgi:hypothetical protein
VNFDPKQKYPVIETIYAGPQGSFVPKTFSTQLGMQTLAELGFIVVQIDGMGTANRSKAFHDVAWKNLGDAGFPDRILWHKAVAAKYPYYDITRVGIYGTSAGGQNAKDLDRLYEFSLDQLSQAETDALSSLLLLAVGRAAEALPLTRRALDRPDRRGGISSQREQATAPEPVSGPGMNMSTLPGSSAPVCGPTMSQYSREAIRRPPMNVEAISKLGLCCIFFELRSTCNNVPFHPL